MYFDRKAVEVCLSATVYTYPSVGLSYVISVKIASKDYHLALSRF